MLVVVVGASKENKSSSALVPAEDRLDVGAGTGFYYCACGAWGMSIFEMKSIKSKF